MKDDRKSGNRGSSGLPVEDERKSRSLLASINKVQSGLVLDEDPRIAFDKLLKDILALTGSEYGFIGEVLYASGGEPYLKTYAITNIAWDRETRHFYKKHAPEGMEFHNLDTLFGVSVKTGRTVISNNPMRDRRRGNLPKGHPPLKAFLCVPFYSGKNLIGMAGLANRAGGYDRKLVRSLSPLFSTCANIIAAHRLYRERLEAERKARETRDYLRSVLDGAADPVIVIERDYRVTLLNRAARDFFPETPENEDALFCYQISHQRQEPCSHHGEEFCPHEEVFRSGKKVSVVHEHINSEGESRYVEITAAPLVTEGETTGVIESFRDITERKRMEEKLRDSLREKEMLIKEVHHRVKNNLAVISSLLSLQSRELEDEKTRGIFDQSRDRVKSMSLIHEKLYRSDDLTSINFRDYIRELTAHLFSSFDVNPRVALHIDIADIPFDIDTLVPCGLIVNELVSNSLKHAFPSGREGRLDVLLNTGEEGWQTLVVRDNGEGFPEDVDFRNTDSLGLQIVTSLVTQLGGTMELVRDRGTEFRVHFKERRYRKKCKDGTV